MESQVCGKIYIYLTTISLQFCWKFVCTNKAQNKADRHCRRLISESPNEGVDLSDDEDAQDILRAGLQKDQTAWPTCFVHTEFPVLLVGHCACSGASGARNGQRRPLLNLLSQNFEAMMTKRSADVSTGNGQVRWGSSLRTVGGGCSTEKKKLHCIQDLPPPSTLRDLGQ
mmetsp:Transcript_20739/g.29210  ORF Transcript_20739/g.29210 Transcript_20739/m.29210 type:complete len:170 (+) Transcript_20739:78-587(+)